MPVEFFFLYPETWGFACASDLEAHPQFVDILMADVMLLSAETSTASFRLGESFFPAAVAVRHRPGRTHCANKEGTLVQYRESVASRL